MTLEEIQANPCLNKISQRLQALIGINQGSFKQPVVVSLSPSNNLKRKTTTVGSFVSQSAGKKSSNMGLGFAIEEEEIPNMKKEYLGTDEDS